MEAALAPLTNIVSASPATRAVSPKRSDMSASMMCLSSFYLLASLRRAPDRQDATGQLGSGSVGGLLHSFDPLGAPGRRLPGLPKVDRLTRDLVVAEFHDVDRMHRLRAIVGDDVLGHPELATAADALRGQ